MPTVQWGMNRYAGPHLAANKTVIIIAHLKEFISLEFVNGCSNTVSYFVQLLRSSVVAGCEQLKFSY